MITAVSILLLFILTLQVLLALACIVFFYSSVSLTPFFIPKVQIVIIDYLHPFHSVNHLNSHSRRTDGEGKKMK